MYSYVPVQYMYVFVHIYMCITVREALGIFISGFIEVNQGEKNIKYLIDID